MKMHKKPSKQRNPKKNLGYLHVYTGEGKGKTSAALGVLLRAAGQGHRVLMIQFLKGHKDAGEFLAFQQLGDNVEIVQFGRTDLTSLEAAQAVDAYFAVQGLNYAREALRGRRRPDLLILDEVTAAVHHGLLPIEALVDFLENRHRNTEVILTGVQAHPALLNMADLVTVMYPAKHYFENQNFEPRIGIEH